MDARGRNNKADAALLRRVAETAKFTGIWPLGSITAFDWWMFPNHRYDPDHGWFEPHEPDSFNSTRLIIAFSLAAILAEEDNRP